MTANTKMTEALAKKIMNTARPSKHPQDGFRLIAAQYFLEGLQAGRAEMAEEELKKRIKLQTTAGLLQGCISMLQFDFDKKGLERTLCEALDLIDEHLGVAQRDGGKE